ncbi:MAG: LysR family transcriptional regulator [Oscillatoriales cyanobacterium C42_A2020_001]|nr:LysR family transcriptional regulator [Leptolyngbyaceae cyanobacterium C42_A2020_001]
MRLEQLQAFLAVAEMGSFQKAAQKCGVTQSAISRQIQALEADLGTPVFHRSVQATLTVAGDRLLPRARKICQEWQTAVQDVNDLISGKQPELCVAAIHSICSHHLPPVLQQFCRDYPDVQLRVTALGSDRSLKVLKDGLVDLAIVMNNRFLTTGPEMIVKVLYKEPIQVLIAANHPLAKFEAIPWEELTKYPQVVFKDGYGMQRIVQEQFERRGSPLKAALELNTPDAFRGVVRQGELVALLPETALVDAYRDPTLAIRAIEPDTISVKGSATDVLSDPPLTRQVVMVTTRDRLQIPPILHFYTLVADLLPRSVIALPLSSASVEG